MSGDWYSDLVKSIPIAKGNSPISGNRADIFSPQSFDEYIGQEKAKKLAQIWVRAAKIQQKMLPSTLITGEFGTGKTSLAKLILREYEGKWIAPVDASNIGLDKIERLTRGVPVIVDEIHNLNSETQDSLNILLDTGTVSIIGCTTDSGALTAPFRSRFRVLHLEPYSVEDLIQIIALDVGKKGGVEVTPSQYVQIALRSRFNARQATQNLDMIFDLMSISETIELTDEIMLEAFELSGVDENGLRAIDRKYMSALNTRRPTGIQAIAAKIGVDPHTILEEIEPYLMRKGLVDRQPRGRISRTTTYGES